MRKDDIDFHSDGMGRTAHAAVNVKVRDSIRSVKLPLDLGGVSDADGKNFREVFTDPGFTHDWIEEHVPDIDAYFEMACADGWEQLGEEAERIWGSGYHVHSEGRSGGWAVVCYGSTCGHGRSGQTQFDRDDVAGWDAIALSKWARFAKFARAVADDVTRSMVDSIYVNVFEPWKEEQERVAKEESALPAPNR